MKARFACLLLLVTGCVEGENQAGPDDASGLFVLAGAVGGDGSRAAPFGSLEDAESHSSAGDTIYLLSGPETLDGGIALKSGQKLIGLDENEGQARVTNSTERHDGVAVVLATGNEVRNIAFVDLVGFGVHGAGLDPSGVVITDNSFSGAADAEYDAEAPRFAVVLEAGAGEVDNVVVTSNKVTNSPNLGGIFVEHRGTSSGSYQFADNHFNDLPGRAYHLWSQDDSILVASILDSSADNIGVGGRNSDSILPHVSGRSKMSVLVKNYRYNNTNQVGNPSNCGLEAFLMGPPFPGEALACVGCSLDLKIEDSVFENPVTDGIQLVNFGTDARLNVEIRGTRVVNANPQQIGGGISLLAQNDQNSGSRTTLLVENTEVIDSSGFGFALLDEGEGYTATVDLGGGELGSAGNNRFVGSARGELSIVQGGVVAKNNWWGREDVRQEVQGERSTVAVDQALAADPALGQ